MIEHGMNYAHSNVWKIANFFGLFFSNLPEFDSSKFLRYTLAPQEYCKNLIQSLIWMHCEFLPRVQFYYRRNCFPSIFGSTIACDVYKCQTPHTDGTDAHSHNFYLLICILHLQARVECEIQHQDKIFSTIMGKAKKIKVSKGKEKFKTIPLGDQIENDQIARPKNRLHFKLREEKDDEVSNALSLYFIL